jgi:hypothetical protein
LEVETKRLDLLERDGLQAAAFLQETADPELLQDIELLRQRINAAEHHVREVAHPKKAALQRLGSLEIKRKNLYGGYQPLMAPEAVKRDSEVMSAAIKDAEAGVAVHDRAIAAAEGDVTALRTKLDEMYARSLLP